MNGNQDSPDLNAISDHPLRVMSLHALLYCERLFYLEEVEEIRVASASVYAGRRLHEQVVPLDDETHERRSVEVASEELGLIGKVDAVRKRDRHWVAYEHKRGRCMRGEKKQVLPWPSDRIQAIAYAALLSESFGEAVAEARVRYHADNVTAIIPVDEVAIADLKAAIDRARQLQQTTERPPITSNENLCTRCSLAPVCLPEEERLQNSSESSEVENSVLEERSTPKLFPSVRQKQTLHVCVNKARVGRSGEAIVVAFADELNRETKQLIPVQDLDSIVIHGYAQISTQAIHLCAHHGVAVQWMTYGGRFAVGTSSSPGRVQQRIRQYAALQDESVRLRLARALVHAKVEMQLKYLLRCTRGRNANRSAIENEIALIRTCLRGIDNANSASALLGFEGTAAKGYFASIPVILSSNIPPEMVPSGRSKHPP